jgi:hypothetical protein
MRRSRRGEVVNCNQIQSIITMPETTEGVHQFVIEPQRKSQWCYASAIEAVLRHHNIHDTQENIAQWYQEKEGRCNTDKKGLNCPQDPIDYLQTYFKVTTITNVQIIENMLNKAIKEPLIGLVDKHYIVIVGQDHEFIYYYDPMHGSTFTNIPPGLKKISRNCTTGSNVQKIPIEYVDQNNKTLQGSFEIKGFYVLSRLAGGKRRTRRRRGSKRRAKTVRRR